MSSMPHTPTPDPEPTAEDLAAIEAEWPLIAADLDVLDAEITILTSTRTTDLDWRRLRRAEAGLIRAYLDAATRAVPTSHADPVVSVGGVAA